MLNATFGLGVALLPVLWYEGNDFTVASVPKVLDGQCDSSAGEEMTQTMAVEYSI